jgi:lipopolysaccharide heptosyltransferase II
MYGDWTKLNPKRHIKSEKTALIVKLGQIGDVIMAIPAARALYDKGFEIHWACGLATRSLLESYSWINLIPVNDKDLFLGSPFQLIVEVFRLWSKIAFKRFDLCATLYYDRRYGLLTLPVWAGRRLSLSWRQRNTMLVPGRHYTDEFTRILLELEDTCREESIPPVRPDHLPPSPIPSSTAPRRVAIVPGGAKNILREQYLRRWPIERYVELTQHLLSRSWEVVLIGGPDDQWVRPYFDGLVVTDCLGALSLTQVISVCDSCDAVITHDTGPLHLAGLSNSALIGLFGPTSPPAFLPRRPDVVGIWGGHRFACRPCYDGRDFAPCKFNGCMHEITLGRVLHELDRLLDARSQGKTIPWQITSAENDAPHPSMVNLMPVVAPLKPQKENQVK